MLKKRMHHSLIASRFKVHGREIIESLSMATGGSPSYGALISIFKESGLIGPSIPKNWFTSHIGRFPDVCEQYSAPSINLGPDIEFKGLAYVSKKSSCGRSAKDKASQIFNLIKESSSMDEFADNLSTILSSDTSDPMTNARTYIGKYIGLKFEHAKEIQQIDDIPDSLRQKCSRHYFRSKHQHRISLNPQEWRISYLEMVLGQDSVVGDIYKQHFIKDSPANRERGRDKLLSYF